MVLSKLVMRGSFLTFLLAWASLMAACSGTASVVQDDEGPAVEPRLAAVSDVDTLIVTLEALGAQVLRGEEIEQPFFSVQAQVLIINGGEVQVFEYDDTLARQTEAGQVGTDGSSVGTTMITWIGKPHFFQTGRILVIYVGEDLGIIEILEDILGEQFAGR